MVLKLSKDFRIKKWHKKNDLRLFLSSHFLFLLIFFSKQFKLNSFLRLRFYNSSFENLHCCKLLISDI